jgi:hypothetical protein
VIIEARALSQDISISGMRLMLRLANAFLLDVFNASRTSGDFTDSLIIVGLVPSSSAVIAGDAALQREYAGFHAPPPEKLRRRISVNALAASLGLPFETVRRRLKGLVLAGVCEVTEDGVRLSSPFLASDAHRLALESVYHTTKAFYARLRQAGCLPGGAREAPTGPPLPPGDLPVRIVWRAVASYTLRMMELLLPGFASPASAFVCLAVVTANTRHLADSVRGGDSLEPDAFVSDALRRPARPSEIADLVGLPYETARRNLAMLVEDGRCRRVGKGFILPAETLFKPRLFAALTFNITNLNRMMATFAETGVLVLWDAELDAQS